jgi:hypothetical protein
MLEIILPTRKCKSDVCYLLCLTLITTRFSMARAADPAGKRTVGIITKCDALQPGDEEGVSD